MLRAIELLDPWVSDIQASNLYSTAPVYVEDQPTFLNMAIRGRTALAPFELLTVTQSIEIDLGRVRAARYGPRQIDLDIVYYSDLQISAPNLTIPHPLRAERRFVLAPLTDIAGDWRDPQTGNSIRQMLSKLPDDYGECISLGPITERAENQVGADD